MKRSLRLLALVAGLALTSSAHSGRDEIAVIVNPDVSIKKLSRDELRPIFQTTKTAWAGGKALPLNLPGTDSSRTGFDAAVLGLDPDRVARYWIDRKIRGGNPPPKTIPNSAIIVKLVAAKKEAIGYIPAADATQDVKVVAKIRGGDVVAP